MLNKLRDAGRFKPYVIFAMCDETFSILCSINIPDNVDRGFFSIKMQELSLRAIGDEDIEMY